MNPWFFATILGEVWVWIAVLITFVLSYFSLRKNMKTKKRKLFKRFLKTAIIAVVITIVAVFMIKGVMPIDRPCVACVDGINENCNPYCDTTPSFPSGHSGIAFAGFGSIFLVFRRKWVMIFPVLVAVSRVALGVHTPLDVIVGSAIGIAVSWIVYKKIVTA